jgi:hypothetical protein
MQSYAKEDFRIICAWCSMEIRAPRRQLQEKAPESHGVCRSCAIGLGAPPELLDFDNQ